jgi:hypothetical protein
LIDLACFLFNDFVFVNDDRYVLVVFLNKIFDSSGLFLELFLKTFNTILKNVLIFLRIGSLSELVDLSSLLIHLLNSVRNQCGITRDKS